MNSEYLKNIDAVKEVLDALPKNNAKNRKDAIKKIDELLKEYNDNLATIKKEMVNRYNKYSKYNKVDNSSLLKEIEDISSKLYLVDSSDSFKKSSLDRKLYLLDNFFNNDLDSVNKTIKEVIDIFDTVGIKLTLNDFNYSIYVTSYMNEFFKGDSAKIKACFDKIYFKSPSLFKQLTMNFKYLYLKNIKLFNNYYKIKQTEVLNNKTIDNVYDDYIEKVKNYNNLERQNLLRVYNDFLDNKMNTKDYTKDQILKYYGMFTSNEINLDDTTNINEVLEKLSLSLSEFKCYLEYKFIIDDIKALYKDKDKYKGIGSQKLKEIVKKESALFSNNKKIIKLDKNRNKLFNKSNDLKIEKLNYSNELLFNELHALYKEYDTNLFLENIFNFNDSTNLFEVLDCANGNYNYLVNLITKDDNTMESAEVDKIIDKLDNYLKNIKFKMLSHISISDENEFDNIIIDKNNLLGLKLNKDMLLIDNIDNLLKTIDILLNYQYIKAMNIDDINYVISYLKLDINEV